MKKDNKGSIKSVVKELSKYEGRILNINEYKLDFSKTTDILFNQIVNSLNKADNHQRRCLLPN